MLQQTRVDQAIPYFKRFVERFPDIESLALAELDEVLKAWEGLGYYSRARNMHNAAVQIMAKHDDAVPSDPVQLRALPGIGPYTSAAILSIAFGQPFAVLDGNVIRVLARVFAINDDTRLPKTRRSLQSLANALINKSLPGDHNEAIMELGATVCTPQSPKCSACPLATCCKALATNAVDAFPFKSKKKPTPHYHIAVGILKNERGEVLVQKRPTSGMLGGLWEFPGGKQEKGESLSEACRRELREELGVEAAVGNQITSIKQAYSHFSITLHAFACTSFTGEPTHHLGEPIKWVDIANLHELAFPRANQRIVELLQAIIQKEPPE